MTLFFSNHQITIFRSRKHAGVDKYSLSATFTGYSADIQPASPSRIELVQGRVGTTYTAFLDATVDVKEGDVIVTADGKRYGVTGIQRWQGAGLLDHLELVLTSKDA